MRKLNFGLNRFKIFLIMVGCMAALTCAAQTPDVPKPHHTANGFRNIHASEENGLMDFLKWRWQRAWQNIPDADHYDFPLAENDPEFLQANHTQNTLTWIGHATLLLQLAGKNILTDPHFSERTSPVQWAGPKRVVPPGLSLAELPPIDMVVISHDHYDALDEDSIIQLHHRPGGDATTFLVPLGLKKWFEKRGIRRVIELDWWDRHRLDNLEIIAVPVQHWSKRALTTRNQTLWAGWVILAADLRFFFAGDSGYCPHFKEIGKTFGPFDLAAIPIGAYEPRWFMQHHHVNPEEALQIHLDLASKKSVAIHWGTFILTDEPLDEPPARLAAAIKAEKLPADGFVVLKHGQTMPIE
jgi:L-ascorbate metabolism protein UlaG (beta-lactamase superfamily)